MFCKSVSATAKNTRRSTLYFAVVSFFTFYISIHTALVAHSFRARSISHQYSGNKLYELIIIIFILSHCPSLVLCVVSHTKKMHSIKQATHFARKMLITIPYVQYMSASILIYFTIYYSEYTLVIFRHSLAHSQAIYNTQRKSIQHTNIPIA